MGGWSEGWVVHQSGWDGVWDTGEGTGKDFGPVCAVGTILASPGGVRV